MLVELRRLPLGDLMATVPRYVTTLTVAERPVLVAAAVPGAPMTVGYHRFLHTARPGRVGADLEMAGRWLRAFWSATEAQVTPLSWTAEVTEALSGRWDGHVLLAAARGRLATAESRLAGVRLARTAVHGDFWFGNLLQDGERVTGVIDWEAGSTSGWPLRDLARFALSYALYLDRHTRPGHRVLGHPGLRRSGDAPGVRYALLSTSWLSSAVRGFLAVGLHRLGLPSEHWYDVALTGLAEVAAFANDDDFAETHLRLLADLPAHPRRSGDRRP